MRILSRPLKSVVVTATVAAAALLGACTTTGVAASGGLRPEAGPVTAAPGAPAISPRYVRQAQPPRSSFMALGDRALPPVGFMEFCTRYPAECGRSAAEAQPVREGGYDRYYWAAAFAGGPAAGRSRAPAPAQTLAYAPQARFDWSLVFGAAGAGQAARADSLRADPVAPTAAAVVAVTLDGALWTRLGEVNRRINGAIREESDLKATGVADHWDLPLADGRRVGDCEDFALEKRRALMAQGVPESALSLALVVTRWGESHAVLVVRTDAGDYVMDSLRPEVAPWRELDYSWVARQAPGDPARWVKVG